MQTWEAITSRRNVRSFADRPIPAADLDQILEAGRRSPSSQNWQPWDFIVVTDRRQLRELARVWRGAGHVAGSAATIVVVGPAAAGKPPAGLGPDGRGSDGRARIWAVATAAATT
jgi:nitroreductase